MKKNRMMRLASGLMVAVLLTTSLISGTFAKYTTSADASDAARVAKWGVDVSASGLLFAEAYGSKGNGNDAAQTDDTITVQSVAMATEKDSLVAPGTQNNKGITFSITGTPEVMVDVDIIVTGTEAGSVSPVDIFLKNGQYADYTTGTSVNSIGGETTKTGDKDYFEFADVYYPVKFTLTQTKTGSPTVVLVPGGTLQDVEKALEAASFNKTFAPNTDLGKDVFGTFNLTWTWDYPETVNEEIDQKDTLLGQLAADNHALAKAVLSGTDVSFTKLTKNDDYGLDTNLKIAISVTQVD